MEATFISICKFPNSTKFTSSIFSSQYHTTPQHHTPSTRHVSHLSRTRYLGTSHIPHSNRSMTTYLRTHDLHQHNTNNICPLTRSQQKKRKEKQTPGTPYFLFATFKKSPQSSVAGFQPASMLDFGRFLTATVSYYRLLSRIL
jgi:hypothetical protein